MDRGALRTLTLILKAKGSGDQTCACSGLGWGGCWGWFTEVKTDSRDWGVGRGARLHPGGQGPVQEEKARI